MKSKLSFLSSNPNPLKPRVASQYFGGEFRHDTGAEEVTCALGFQGVSWKDQDIYALQVLNTLFGSSASFSSGGPGKGMHSRATKHLLNRVAYVDAANALNIGFTDIGLFGLTLSGPSNNVS